MVRRGNKNLMDRKNREGLFVHSDALIYLWAIEVFSERRL